MSNDVTLFKNGVPDYLRKKELNAVTKSLLGGTQSKRISIRGNAFRMIVNGEEIAVSNERTMKVVIVNVAPEVSRSYYDKQYVAGSKASPICWSANGNTPNAKSKTPQHTNCADCPQNVKGSGQQNSRACKFSRAIAVLLENDLDGDLYALSLPAQSIFGKSDNGNMPLNAYAQFLAGFNVNVTDVVTEMRFDTDSATPKLFFKAVRPLTEEEHGTCTERGASKEAKDLVTIEYKAEDDEPQAPATAVAPAPKAKRAPAPAVEEDEEETPAPKKREKAGASEAAPAKADISKLLDEWDDE
jgi:hypothetical protein